MKRRVTKTRTRNIKGRTLLSAGVIVAAVIQVDDCLTKGGKAVRVLAMPIPLAADGVMMIGAIVSFP
ncbi:hypothetical protein BDI4_40063 [Burkholderia diffusa]|nr:hypothetical protein BDI4_40063 [Burkholderia diffusa]